MAHRRLLSAFSILAVAAAVFAFPAPALAQQAEAYSNPLDSSNDTSGWYLYDYFNYWGVDNSPIDGHDGGASLNCNDGTGLDYLGYNYMEMQSTPIDINGMQDPVLTWWCLIDLPDPNQNYFDGYLNLYDGNYNEYYGLTMGTRGWEDLQCSSEWHQHQVTIPSNIQGAIIFAPYVYFEDYYYEPGNQGWFLDEMKILVADVTAPEIVNDLAAGTPTETSVPLTWTSPHDDDVSGMADSFTMVYSTSVITEANFNSATPLPGEPDPGVDGTSHTLTVQNLTGDTTYFFAVRSTDKAGNVSQISNVATVTTLAPPPPPEEPPAPSGNSNLIEQDEDILPCAAGTTAAPTGLLALAGLIALAALAGALRK